MSFTKYTSIQILCFTLCIVLLSSSAYCQQRNEPIAKASTIFLEIGGNAIVYSLNYDRRFFHHNKGLGGRIGISYVPKFGHGGSPFLVLPVGVNYLVGETHCLELGAGATFEFEQGYTPDQNIYFVPSVGYRFQPVNKSFSFRLFFSPFFGEKYYTVNSSGERKERTVRPWGGLSVGFRF
jgi:hypothetical protein